MMKFSHVLASLILMASPAFVAAQVPRPTKAPAALPSAQAARFQSGLTLQEAGNNFEAAEMFEALALDAPDAPQVNLQAAICWSAVKQYDKAIAAALRGMDYKSQWLGKFYLLAAEGYYRSGRGSESIPFFQAAIAVEPDNASAYYELGVAFASLKRMEEAREALKGAAALAPDRPDAHYALGVIWSAQGYKIPALLALCRFLVLEPEGDRARGALKAVSDALDEMGGTFGVGGPLRSAPDNAEGDFTAAIGAVATAWKAAREDQSLDNWTRVTRSVDSLFVRISRPDSAWSGSFAASFYAPYFAAIATQKLTDPFCAHLYRSANNELVDAYLKDHADKVYAFLKWSQAYRWPRPAAVVPGQPQGGASKPVPPPAAKSAPKTTGAPK